MIKAFLGASALSLASVAAAVAAPVATKDAADFKYRWDFDLTDDGVGINDNLDLYNNTTGAAGADGVNDWNVNTNGTTITVTDGALDLNDAGIQQRVWSGVPDITHTSGYTLEYRIHVSSVEGAAAGWGPVIDSVPENAATGGGTSGYASVTYTLDETSDPENPVVNLHWTVSTPSAANQKTSVPFSDDFFTVRVAAEYNADALGNQKLDFSLYVNDVLIEGDMGPSHSAIVGSNRSFVLLVGSNHGGHIELDYYAFTPGAFAPVPEPASLALLTAGAGLILARRRAA